MSIPRRTAIIILILVLTIAILAFIRTRPQPDTPQPLPPSPTQFPSPFPITASPASNPQASASAIPLSPTPLSKNPKTGWLLYYNPFHQFSFEFPSVWKLEDYGKSFSPMAAVVSELNGSPIGFTVSTVSWGTESDLAGAQVIGGFTYNGWRGSRYQLTDSSQTLTIISATQSAAPNKVYRVNWVYPTNDGAIDIYLKPILNTFRFSIATNSAQLRVGE